MTKGDLHLRVDPEIADALQALADEKCRSVAKQVEWLIKRALAKRAVKMPSE